MFLLDALCITLFLIALILLMRKIEEPQKPLKSKEPSKKAMGKGRRTSLIPHTERNASGCNWKMFQSVLISVPLNSNNPGDINKNLSSNSGRKYFPMPSATFVTKEKVVNNERKKKLMEEKVANNKNKKKLTEEKVANNKNKKKLTDEKIANNKNNKELTKEVAIDCEMVGIGDGSENMLARVSIVNRHGVCVYDKYVKPREPVQDYRTKVSGIRPHDVENGEEFDVVQREVAEILKDRILVGHALKHDLDVLYLSHPRRNLRDTSRFKRFTQLSRGNTPSLKKLSQELLGKVIQIGEHSSVEDARAAMELYMLFRNIWESEFHRKR